MVLGVPSYNEHLRGCGSLWCLVTSDMCLSDNSLRSDAFFFPYRLWISMRLHVRSNGNWQFAIWGGLIIVRATLLFEGGNHFDSFDFSVCFLCLREINQCRKLRVLTIFVYFYICLHRPYGLALFFYRLQLALSWLSWRVQLVFLLMSFVSVDGSGHFCSTFEALLTQAEGL